MTTINPDSSLHAEDGENADDDEGDGYDDDDDEQRPYTRTKPDEWTMLVEGDPGRTIASIPFTGDDYHFRPNVTEEELNGFMDEGADIRFHRIFEWLLPQFEIDGSVKSFYEFLAGRMRNYMSKSMLTGWTPKYYDPKDEKHITADHVARFFGCQIARSLRGHPAIDRCWSTRESLDSIGVCMESMTKNAFEDMYRCLHFSDDWDADEGDKWDELYSDKKMSSPDNTARHRCKFAMIEDAFNRRWKECVRFGCWLTFDESRVAGWYHSPMTQGPDPKPIRTGATIHSLAVTHGDFASYKLHVRVFGGKTDQDLGKRSNLTVGIQKWVNLLSLMLDDFKGRGHCVTMDSAYMGDIMALIGHEVWKINMVGTTQTNRTGAEVSDILEKMKKKLGTYNSVFWQHKTRPLCYALWSDNSIVKTLSNFHGPVILEAGIGVMRKKRDEDGNQERTRTEVPCPSQIKDYCETFHLIDKGNGAEANFDLGGKSQLHNWSPKLIFCLYNMALNNAYKMYTALHKRHNGGRRILDMGDAVRELTHDLCQRGPVIRKMKAEHPVWLRDMTRLFGWKSGRTIRSDAFGFIPHRARPILLAPVGKRYSIWRHNCNRSSPWMMHQSEGVKVKGRCCWDDCPGKRTSKAIVPRSSDTHMRCEECSRKEGMNIYLCNSSKWSCHRQYHLYHHNNR